MHSKDDETNLYRFIFRLVLRLTLFLTLFLSAMLIFYAIGNYQKFLDSNISLILKITTISAIPLIFIALLNLILSIIQLVKNKFGKKWKYILCIFFSFLSFFYALFITLTTSIIESLSKGI